MRKAKAKQIGILKIMGWKQVLTCALCCLLFLGMLLLNLRELMQLGNENAYRNCQNSYLLAACELDDYLRLTNEAVESAARRIEEIRAGGATDEELLAYMTRESSNLDERIASETAAVYGVIGGTFMHGAGWVPGADFVPTERPWYVKAVAEGGAVTHVPPYTDAVTGLPTITVSKLLSDGVSVVAMDLTTDKLQRVVDEIANAEDGYAGGDASRYGYAQIFVMDDEGAIIAHSDPAKQLKNFTETDDPVERAIAEQILTNGQTFFQLDDNGDSLIYCGGELEGCWYVYSGLKYGEVVSRITRNLVISIAAAIVGIAGLIVVMVSLALRRYHEAIIRDYATEVEEENQKLEEKAAAALKIAELTQSVTALLTNMPGMTSSKDVETGKYLACNQAFAEFAGKSRPEDVIGLTNADIFDADIAASFAADDEKALSMDEPYSFYEETTDAAGNARQFQTTKLKFTDTAGRLCTLCMRQDYTELMRVRQETVEAKAAYEKAQQTTTIFSHIAHSLAAGYSHLYYVNMVTEDFIKYTVDTESGEVSEERRGTGFFGDGARNSLVQIYEDDKEAYLRAFSKEKVLLAMAERGSFSVSYRVIRDGEVKYVTMRALPVQGEDDHLLLGVSRDNIEARSELTGLYLETPFSVHGRDAIKEHPTGWCMIAIDLEHFKLFNEWFGRDTGDTLLAQIGETLRHVVEETGGLACYKGQDDFCLMIPYDEAYVKKIFASIHELVMEHGTSVGFMPAFGVCMIDGSASVEELYDRASQASQHAKEDYHRRIRIFEEAMYRKTEQDYKILSDFQLAIQNHELFIQLQPQCEIAGGKVVGAESLVRWKKADGSMVSPGIFVPVLEQYGFVTDLDQFVWEEVCAWQKAWI
ncbi:MAG: EAL domain-containing protein, partial [Clostridium lundense]|nr:EAL domain-containing protein [Clostridium lundense]